MLFTSTFECSQSVYSQMTQLNKYLVGFYFYFINLWFKSIYDLIIFINSALGDQKQL